MNNISYVLQNKIQFNSIREHELLTFSDTIYKQTQPFHNKSILFKQTVVKLST